MLEDITPRFTLPMPRFILTLGKKIQRIAILQVNYHNIAPNLYLDVDRPNWPDSLCSVLCWKASVGLSTDTVL